MFYQVAIYENNNGDNAMIDIDAQDELYGLSGLRIAMQRHRNGVANMLTDKGADIDLTSSASVWTPTPLHAAIENGNIEMAKALIHRGANLEAETCHGDSALFCGFVKILRSCFP